MINRWIYQLCQTPRKDLDARKDPSDTLRLCVLLFVGIFASTSKSTTKMVSSRQVLWVLSSSVTMMLVILPLPKVTAFVSSPVVSKGVAASATTTTSTTTNTRTTSSQLYETKESTSQIFQTPEQAAASLTEYMARAHEEKIRAMASVEKKYKDQIEQLEARIAELEASPVGRDGEQTSSNSYAFPATNKALAEQVRAYQTFLQDYFIKTQAEKLKAVQAAEAKITAKYEAILNGESGN